ncbi:MAG: hypothetical protein IPL27_11475 [Lewinellaceae bacterium]|nr:hypothetical protein [Lewinellaceae bacterium]
MTKKIYNILLDDNKIGTTKLEHADPPMGVVMGQIHFINISSGYDFIKTYCLANHIEINTDYPDDRFISTFDMEKLKVVDQMVLKLRDKEQT